MVLNVLGTLQVPGGGKAFEELTTTSMARFNDDFPNVDGVSYFSYGARCQPSILDAFRMSWGVIQCVSPRRLQHGWWLNERTSVISRETMTDSSAFSPPCGVK